MERYPRKKFQLATKNAAWLECRTREDAAAQFETSLRQTGAGYIDFYLLHNLGEGRTHFFDDFDMWRFVQEKKKEGLIRHVGFSFHSTPEELEEILKAHPEMEFVQLQINYGDWENPAIQSQACYEMARKYGKPVIVMEPVKGGMLATPPESVAEILKRADAGASMASWAIRFAADLDGVLTVLSGMSDLAQMEDNLSFMKGFTGLSDAERQTLEWSKVYSVPDLKHIKIVITYIHPQYVGHARPIAGRGAHPHYIVVAPLKVDIMVIHEKIKDSVGVRASVEYIPYDVKLVNRKSTDCIGHRFNKFFTYAALHNGIYDGFVVVVLVFLIVGMQKLIHGIVKILGEPSPYL